MSRFAVRIVTTFLVVLLALAGVRASTGVLLPYEGGETGRTIHTSYSHLIQVQSNTEVRSPQPSISLQKTGAGWPGGPATYAPIQPASEQASTVIDVAEKIAREVYVQGKFVLPITQQPVGKNTYVSTEPSMLTQFGMASRNGVTGLMAHNYLSGAVFYLLNVGQEIDVLYGDGQIRHYRISEILSYQKIRPPDLYSDYLDMQTRKILSTAEIFRRVYRGEHHLTLQTCLERNGNLSWGLYFVIAIPLRKT